MNSVILKCVTLTSLVSCAFAVAIGSAAAADIPFKARPLPPSPSCYDWSGVYGGGHYGYLWGDSHWTMPMQGSQPQLGPQKQRRLGSLSGAATAAFYGNGDASRAATSYWALRLQSASCAKTARQV